MDLWQEFQGVNAGYVLELYDRYRENPQTVDQATRALFEQWKPEIDGARPALLLDLDQIVGIVNLALAIREYGHLNARLDPLGSEPPGDPALDLATHGLTEERLKQLPPGLIGGPIAEKATHALDALHQLQATYSSTTGYDYDHVRSSEERDWLRHAAESQRFRPPQDPIDPVALLDRLTQVEVFERFLHRIFPGKTRFSLEGLDMMVPILDEVIGEAAEAGIHNILIGMAHRGRLNVLAHILNKPYSQILAEFKDPVPGRPFVLRDDVGWTGDVKYHKGARRALHESEEIDLIITMAPNPSHLEYVNPVVEGMARAAGTRVDQPGAPQFDSTVTLPILIHGDAALPGQGVVAETLNLSRLAGYRTGGTIHIIANNQLGYTTTPQAGRSALYASDLAKGFKIPIIHVNADDVEACIAAARLAFAYQARFQKDFLIDLVGYRRHGHNEGDEPSFTQPLMYEKIARHATVREQWAQILLDRELITTEQPEARLQDHMEILQQELESLKPEENIAEPKPERAKPGAARHVKTAVSAQRLRDLNEALLRLPQEFSPHRKIERAMQRRRHIMDNPNEPTIEWAAAEELALASILQDGIAIRLTGQDVERGTFSQRHGVFHDAKTGQRHIPLQTLPQVQAAFEVRNSPLSEIATLGFEFGYNIQEPDRLVIWEAQYGDFINAAQVIVDEFITSARAKWGQTSSLVLLLPHGYEGQGPDHSSGRLERFLHLAMDTNLRIANCTTAAQYFHLLRRQALLLKTDPLPLVVMTPKSLLRHPRIASSLRDLSEGMWQPMIDDVQARERPDEIRRLILCSGKVYIDLVTSDRRAEKSTIALVRIEQLFPFPLDNLKEVLDRYSKLDEVVWLQEEPENMGAWTFARPRLIELINGRCPLRYIGRPPSSSPAEGSMAWHAVNQEALIEQAFNMNLSLDETIFWLKKT